MAIIYKQCPKCGSKNSIRIIYGMPTHKTFLEAEAGKIKLGGCDLDDNYPEYHCKDCRYEWNRQQAIDEAYKKIKIIKASVGGYSQGNFEVTVDLIKLEVTWNFRLGGEEKSSKKSMDSLMYKKFIELLKATNILNWKSKYVDPDVCDGTQWEIVITTDQKTIKKYGSNEFPEEWDNFCSTMESIIEQEFR
jgi:hypothetical protein